MRKIIKNGLIITMDEKRKDIIEKKDIIIDDNIITDITDNYNGKYDYLIDAKNKIVLPGLINAHTHLGMSIFRASNDSLNLHDWLNNKIFPIEDKLTDEYVYYTTLISCLEMIKTGTTTCNDMYFYCEGEIKAIKETKIRTLFSRSICDNDGGGERRLNEFLELYEKYKDELLMNFAVAPHSMYTCSKEYLKKCSDIALNLNLPIHMHFCEDLNEVKTIKETYNKDPIDALIETGLLRNKLILAHDTFIDYNKIEKFKNKDVSFVHNPVSNLNLGCGIADITKSKQYVNICLGTDGQGSGNNLNMFYHMSFVDFLQKGIYKDPTIMTSYEVLKMATINGAKALGLEKSIGSIEKNKLADLIILDMSDLLTYPSTEIMNNIVHNAWNNCIDTTIINGEILMENKKLNININEELIKNKINEIINKVM